MTDMASKTVQQRASHAASLNPDELAVLIGEQFLGLRRPESLTATQILDQMGEEGAGFRRGAAVAIKYIIDRIANAELIQ
jgi:hypothetical protein